MLREGKKAPPALTFQGDPEDDETYFTYRPLSNLPTPPLSSRQSSAAQSPVSSRHDGVELLSKYRGPAIHLANLVPCSASLNTLSVTHVHAILTRARLPLETVALAVCILDSLDARFARHWRLSFPLGKDSLAASSSKRHTLPPLPSPQLRQQQLHIDSVSPEIIILAALVIAVKFMDDGQEFSDAYCDAWGRDLWSTDQLNATERCIMERLDYRIMPLCEEGCITDAMVDMQLAGQQQCTQIQRPVSTAGQTKDRMAGFSLTHNRSRTTCAGGLTVIMQGTATPCETPESG